MKMSSAFGYRRKAKRKIHLGMMMSFFNQNWAGARSGCWVGLGLILGWSAGRASLGLG